MSWSVTLVGRPDGFAKALEEFGEKLDGQSKVVFEDAKPHLAALVQQNFSQARVGHLPPMVKLSANGHGTASTDPETGKTVQINRVCAVSIEGYYGQVVV